MRYIIVNGELIDESNRGEALAHLKQHGPRGLKLVLIPDEVDAEALSEELGASDGIITRLGKLVPTLAPVTVRLLRSYSYGEGNSFIVQRGEMTLDLPDAENALRQAEMIL